jgi:CheY-like chemotaxis protein
VEPFKCLPFYHPTRVAFVDDEPSFLAILLNRLRIRLPVLTYESPLGLLADLEQGRVQASLMTDWWTCRSGAVGDSASERVVILDKAMIFQHLYDENRFDTLGVLVVDYEMPSMSGLALCRRIADLPCKKILLTGQADSDTVLRAFNEGLIDLYISKYDRKLELELASAIQRFQIEFMTESTDVLAQVLRAEDPGLWSDERFCRLLHQICADLGAVEYYAVEDPKGFLLVDRNAKAKLLLLLTAGEIDAQCAAAQVSRAPHGVIAELRSRRGVLHFPDDGSHQVLTLRQWWDACVPAHPLPGRSDRFYALVDGPEPFPVTSETVLSLGRYLAAPR